MRALSEWNELGVGGAVAPERVEQPHTGSWRTGSRPDVDLARCVNCLLCWLYCPDSAVRLDGTTFTGIDLDFCKGCELCEEICPVDAIRMVDDVT